MTRENIGFLSGGDLCDGWLHRGVGTPNGERAAVVILGHGLGAKEMRLPAYAERFAAAGHHAIVFDFRGSGDRGGNPRSLVSRRRRLQDWDAAIRFARAHPEVDAERIAVWGNSSGGGLAIGAAVRNPDVAAVIAQCPFTDGAAAVGDRPEGKRIAARFAPYQRPGTAIPDVTAPLLLCLCDDDLHAPAGATLRHAAATGTTVRRYPFGHVGLHAGAGFDAAVADQLDFLATHLARESVR